MENEEALKMSCHSGSSTRGKRGLRGAKYNGKK